VCGANYHEGACAVDGGVPDADVCNR